MRLSYGGMAWTLLWQELERLQRAVCIMITGAMITIPTKVLEMFLDLLTLGMVVEFAALMAAYSLPRPNSKNLGIGYNRIWVKADKVDNKFSMIKDHITLRRTFGKHPIVIPTREEWDKNWPNWLRKGQVWFTDGACNRYGTGAGICKNKIQWHISLAQDAIVFQAEIAAILDWVTRCLKQRPVKEQITICTDSQAAVAALAANGTK